MAGQVRHLKVKGGRFYALLAVPANLRPIIGKSELVTPLGGERRAAMKALPAAVAMLQRQIAEAEAPTAGQGLSEPRSPITTADYGRAVWQRYSQAIADDEMKRARLPTPAAIEAAQNKVFQHFRREGIPRDPVAVMAQSLDWLVLKDRKHFDQSARTIRLDALRRELAANETHQVEHDLGHVAKWRSHSLMQAPSTKPRKLSAVLS